MSSGLIWLEIIKLETTSCTITSLLAGLPRLGTFIGVEVKVTDGAGGTNLISRIPFFEDNNLARLHSPEDQQDPPDWIPPTARFGDLEIDATYFIYKAVLVNQ